MTDPDYVDNQVQLANTPIQAESRRNSPESAAECISLNGNENKIEYLNFNQKGDISNQSCKPLKIKDQLIYFGSNISSTENDVSKYQA